MGFDAAISGSFDDFAPRGAAQGAFAFEKRTVLPKAGNQLQVSFMEIPPGKSAFPYHWHEGITESYVVLSGTGLVRTADGERTVGPGEVIVLPPGPAGAHRMTNVGDVPLRYVDIDSTSDPDVYHYPDSGKTGWYSARGGDGMFRDSDEAAYYEGEPDAD